MKKILLFALTIGLGTYSFAQTPTNISINSLIQPTGTIYIDGSGNGNVLTTIEISIRNNDPAVTFVTGSQFSYSVKLDGTALLDPNSTGWVRNLAIALAPTESQDVMLTSSWAVSTTKGTHELCASLNNVVVIANPPAVYVNNDQNKEICADFTFDFTTSVANLSLAEISQITMKDEVMTVFVKNAGIQANIQIMNITGQVIKTVNSSASGQNFYQEINISELKSGVYIVSVQTENGMSAAQKVFIQ